MTMTIKKGLGKGLEALLSIYDEESAPNSNISEKQPENNQIKESDVVFLPISNIIVNPNQPRKKFDQETLNELADSIKQHGVLQPILVVKAENNTYMIVAGERRFRASTIAGLNQIPCLIKDLSERQVKEISLIENLQREDLNPIEASRAIKQLMEEYHFTQEIVAERIGKSRSNIANLLRLLTLHPEVLKLVEENKLSAGHARALVVIEDVNQQIKLANYVVEKNLSVRELEKMVKALIKPNTTIKRNDSTQSPELTSFVEEMQRVFATKVSVVGNDNKGRIYIDYFSKDDLDRIFDLIELIKSKQLTLQDLSNFNKRK